MPEDAGREEVEHVPWSDLMEESDERRRRVIYLASGLVGALVLGVVLARVWWAPAVPAAAPVESVPTTLAGEVPPVPTTSIPELPLYSEADLMADPPDPASRAAVARAEWFVTDYFTADFEPSGSADVRSALPGGADLPNLPQDGGDSISYVEWARAFGVEEVGEGVYEVSVVFRALAAPPEAGFSRQAVKAVAVTIEVTPEGGTTVVDLPSPAALPLGPVADPWPESAEEQPPQSVIDRAAAEASVWGGEPRLVSSHRTGAGWRLVMTVADGVGNRWPMAIRVADF
jgi:hypothetical protein